MVASSAVIRGIELFHTHTGLVTNTDPIMQNVLNHNGLLGVDGKNTLIEHGALKTYYIVYSTATYGMEKSIRLNGDNSLIYPTSPANMAGYAGCRPACGRQAYLR